MNDSNPITASTGAASGRMILKKVWASVQPSIFAASSSDLGIVSKKPLIR